MKTQLNSLNINAKWSYTVGKVYIGKSHWKYLNLKLKGIQHVVYLLSCTGGSLWGQTPLSGALTPSTLDLIGKPCSHLSCDSQLLHRTHFNPLTRRPKTGSMTLRWEDMLSLQWLKMNYGQLLWSFTAGSQTGFASVTDVRWPQTSGAMASCSYEWNCEASGVKERSQCSFQLLLLLMIKHRSSHDIGCSVNQWQWMFPINYAGWLYH